MPVQLLTLDSLKDLDFGKANEAFMLHLRRAAQDCLDRPGDDKPRKVIMEFMFKPDMDATGNCDKVKSQAAIYSKVPTHRTSVYSFGLQRNGSFVFNPDSPTNVDQATFIKDSNDE